MSGLRPPDWEGRRFPGFDVLAQAEHWDRVTAGVVLSRLGMPSAVRFFTPAEQAAAALATSSSASATSRRCPW